MNRWCTTDGANGSNQTPKKSEIRVVNLGHMNNRIMYVFVRHTGITTKNGEQDSINIRS